MISWRRQTAEMPLHSAELLFSGNRSELSGQPPAKRSTEIDLLLNPIAGGDAIWRI
jgi:hypothetical protein